MTTIAGKVSDMHSDIDVSEAISIWNDVHEEEVTAQTEVVLARFKNHTVCYAKRIEGVLRTGVATTRSRTQFESMQETPMHDNAANLVQTPQAFQVEEQGRQEHVQQQPPTNIREMMRREAGREEPNDHMNTVAMAQMQIKEENVDKQSSEAILCTGLDIRCPSCRIANYLTQKPLKSKESGKDRWPKIQCCNDSCRAWLRYSAFDCMCGQGLKIGKCLKVAGTKDIGKGECSPLCVRCPRTECTGAMLALSSKGLYSEGTNKFRPHWCPSASCTGTNALGSFRCANARCNKL